MRIITKVEIAIFTLSFIMIIGTLSYHNLEGWNYVDSFYFTGVTMTTVGYGDLHPTTTLSKIFTVFFAFSGIGITLFTITLLATSYVETRERKIGEFLEKQFIKDLQKNFDLKAFHKRRQKSSKAIVNGTRF